MCKLYIIYQIFKYLQKTPYSLYEIQIRTAVLGNRILYFPLSSNTSSQVSAWISHAQLVKNILLLSSWNRFDEHICQLNISWRVYKWFSALTFSWMKWQSALTFHEKMDLMLYELQLYCQLSWVLDISWIFIPWPLIFGQASCLTW